MKPNPKFKLDPSQPLSNARHEAFVQAILEGAKASDAYRAAGYKSDKPDVVHNEAYRLTLRADISTRLAHLRTKAADESVLTKAWLIEETRDTYAQAKPSGAFNAALKALQMLGLERGTFISKPENGCPREFADWSVEELRNYVRCEIAELGLG